MFFFGGVTILVSWALFTVALLSGPVAGDHDTSFVVISLIYALITTSPWSAAGLAPSRAPSL